MSDQIHAFVTGASKGIGAAVVESLLARGMRVTAVSRTLADLRSRWDGRDGVRIDVCDVTDEAAIDRAFTAAEAEFGPVGVLVNNAGAAESAPFARTDAAMLERMFRLNVAGVFACTRRALPAMREAGRGRIVNMASTAGLGGYAYTSAYCASKHAVIGMTRALAKELAATDITVNAVCPSFTDTDMVAGAIDRIVDKSGRSRDDALAGIVRNNPRGRLMTPQEVAEAAAWLCSDSAGGITGQAIAVDGGETA
jgi:NAD(P)-dependent dehydrogenase (short-subunit alcohol dehydrogenase family)